MDDSYILFTPSVIEIAKNRDVMMAVVELSVRYSMARRYNPTDDPIIKFLSRVIKHYGETVDQIGRKGQKNS